MFLFFHEKGESILEKERRRKRNLNMREMKRETSKECLFFSKSIKCITSYW